ncbi:MAG: hypothetical protein JWQ09_5851 [Segetibacter sp.]|nr:hypothetical protein [Segetibacter sp.]
MSKPLTKEEILKQYDQVPDYLGIGYEQSDVFEAMQVHADQQNKSLIDEIKRLKEDANIMFDALFAIISDIAVDDLGKCMDIAGKAVNNLLDKSIIDRKHNHK